LQGILPFPREVQAVVQLLHEKLKRKERDVRKGHKKVEEESTVNNLLLRHTKIERVGKRP
jgi:hypothetical protein